MSFPRLFLKKIARVHQGCFTDSCLKNHLMNVTLLEYSIAWLYAIKLISQHILTSSVFICLFSHACAVFPDFIQRGNDPNSFYYPSQKNAEVYRCARMFLIKRNGSKDQ